MLQAKASLPFPLLIMHTMSSNGQAVNTFETKPWWLTPSQPFDVQASSQCPYLADEGTAGTRIAYWEWWEKSQPHSVFVFSKQKQKNHEMWGQKNSNSQSWKRRNIMRSEQLISCSGCECSKQCVTTCFKMTSCWGKQTTFLSRRCAEVGRAIKWQRQQLLLFFSNDVSALSICTRTELIGSCKEL